MSDQGAATGTFISQHANPVDAMLVELASPHSKRVYESRLAGVARLLPKLVDSRLSLTAFLNVFR